MPSKTLFLVGRTLGLGQGIEDTGGSLQLAYGRLSEKKGTPEVFRIEVEHSTKDQTRLYFAILFLVYKEFLCKCRINPRSP